jgi:hypothetical protein
MNISRRSLTFGSFSLLSGTAFSARAQAEWGGINLGEGVEDFWLATDAYIFGYPLITMEMTRRVVTNVAKIEGTRQNLKTNEDGSTNLYIQKDSPGSDLESNWLPAPAGKFILMLRMYWPSKESPSILNGSWTIPPIKQA